MNNFDCYPIAFDNDAPKPELIISELLKQSIIPLNVIDKHHKDYKELLSWNSSNQNVQYFIVVIVYLQKFEA